MTIHDTITVELPRGEVDIEVAFEMAIEDHGVGWTEAWGYRSFDSHKVWEVQGYELILPENHDFSNEEIESINEQIEAWYEDDTNIANLRESAQSMDEGLREDAEDFKHDPSRLEDY